MKHIYTEEELDKIRRRPHPKIDDSPFGCQKGLYRVGIYPRQAIAFEGARRLKIFGINKNRSREEATEMAHVWLDSYKHLRGIK